MIIMESVYYYFLSLCIIFPYIILFTQGGQTEEPIENLPMGASCDDGGQCAGFYEYLSECTLSGICACSTGYIVSAKLDKCLPILNGLGKECEESQQCQHGLPGALSACVKSPTLGKKVCNCTKDAVSEPEKHYCYPKAVLVGDSCEVQVQCVAGLRHSHCLNGKCECLEGTLASGILCAFSP